MPKFYPSSSSKEREALLQELRSNLGEWKRHILGNQRARFWLERAGGLSTLLIREVDGGWPYADVNGKPLEFPKLDQWRSEDPPVNPGELCRSVTTDDECWLFTCECSVHACGGINSGILVAHDEGLTIWRSPECPDVPLAVFDQQHYRDVIISSVKILLREPLPDSGLAWTMGVSPKYLRSALNRATAGKSWF